MLRWKWQMRLMLVVMFMYVCVGLGIEMPDKASASGNSDVSPNLIYNGDFELGNLGFYSNLDSRPNYRFPGKFTVSRNSRELDENYADIKDHTSNSGLFMIIDGGSDINTKMIWKQSISTSLIKGQRYKFEAWVTSLSPQSRAELEIQISIDGSNWNSIQSPYKLDSETWKLIQYEWTPAESGYYQIRIINNNVSPWGFGNDLGIDDIYFGLKTKAASTVWPKTPKLVVNNLNYPQGIAVDSKGNMYISGSNSTIIKINPSGNILGSYGGGNCPGFNGSLGTFCFPRGIAIDKNDKIYIADTYNNRIQIMDTNGNFIGKIGNVNYPHDIAIDNSGNFYIPDSSYYLVNRGDSVPLENYIDIIGDNGNLISKMGSNGTNPGQFNLPESIALDPVGNIFVADAKNHRIQKFDSNRNFLLSWGGYGTSNGQFNSPSGITIDNIGNVFIADRLNDRIQVFDNIGTYLGQIGTSGCSGDAGSICRPNDLTLGPDGSLYVVEDRNTFSDGGQANFQNRIEVFDIQSIYDNPIAVTSIQLDKTQISLATAATSQLTATITPSNATNQSVTWSSSNTSVATVDTTGKVTAVGNGTARIIASTVSGNKKATTKVTVTTPVSSVTLSSSSITLAPMQKTGLLASVQPLDASNKSIIWSSSDTQVATVFKGMVTAKQVGTATITPTTIDGGKTASVTVTVKVPVRQIRLTAYTSDISIGQAITLTPQFFPSEATNKQVTWQSSNPSIATVDANGKVTALKKGIVYIQVQSSDDPSKSMKGKITVK